MSYLNEWLNLIARWAHVVIAITWIGTSFYFMRLDMSLRPPRRLRAPGSNLVGETSSAHGGGIYVTEKHRVAPPEAPAPHVATPWPAWGTWITGFVLMIIVYYWHADTFLVDPSVADLSTTAAIAISIALLVGGWFVYDVTCRVLRSDFLVALATTGLIVVVAWGSAQLFSPRAAWLETGAIIGTIMSANVLVVIQPANWALIRGNASAQELAARGARGKQRSVHNSYLTLPVVLAMIGIHFPLLYGGDRSWQTLVILMAIGAFVRHFFIAWNGGRRLWAIPVFAAAALAVVAIVLEPEQVEATSPAPTQDTSSGRALFLSSGCGGCHRLAEAGTTGDVGPDLDAAQPSRDRVLQVVTNGQGAMPPFRGSLSDAQLAALADYVVAASRTK